MEKTKQKNVVQFSLNEGSQDLTSVKPSEKVVVMPRHNWHIVFFARTLKFLNFPEGGPDG